MHLPTFCMYVQNTPECKKTPNKTICFRVNTYHKDDLELETEDGACKTTGVFKNLTESLIKNKTNEIDCCEKKKIRCKECYVVCCYEQRTDGGLRTLTPPHN